jgi:hypothetical protein
MHRNDVMGLLAPSGQHVGVEGRLFMERMRKLCLQWWKDNNFATHMFYCISNKSPLLGGCDSVQLTYIIIILQNITFQIRF